MLMNELMSAQTTFPKDGTTYFKWWPYAPHEGVFVEALRDLEEDYCMIDVQLSF